MSCFCHYGVGRVFQGSRRRLEPGSFSMLFLSCLMVSTQNMKNPVFIDLNYIMRNNKNRSEGQGL